MNELPQLALTPRTVTPPLVPPEGYVNVNYGGTYGDYGTYTGGGSLGQIKDVNSLATRLVSIGDLIIYILTALAVLYIVYATVRYLVMGEEGADRKEAGIKILWGFVGLFIIVSIWGLVSLLTNTFPTYNQMPNSLPSANFISNK